jgi:hypothetical protein
MRTFAFAATGLLTLAASCAPVAGGDMAVAAPPPARQCPPLLFQID